MITATYNTNPLTR